MTTTTDPLAGLDTSGLDSIARNIARDVLRGWHRESDLARRNRVSVQTVAKRKLMLRGWLRRDTWQAAVVALHEAADRARAGNAQNVCMVHAQPSRPV